MKLKLRNYKYLLIVSVLILNSCQDEYYNSLEDTIWYLYKIEGLKKGQIVFIGSPLKDPYYSFVYFKKDNQFLYCRCIQGKFTCEPVEDDTIMNDVILVARDWHVDSTTLKSPLGYDKIIQVKEDEMILESFYIRKNKPLYSGIYYTYKRLKDTSNICDFQRK